MRAEIRVALLGKFSVEGDGVPMLEGAGRRARELLAHLLLHPNRSFRRDALAAILWPGSDRERALGYLRQVLWRLHREIPSHRAQDLIQHDGQLVGAGPLRGIRVDVLEFDAACRSARTSPLRSAEPLASAVRLYRGDLLEGWESPWCSGERDRLRESYFAALGKLMEYHGPREEYEAAIDYASLALGRDPAREIFHRTIMRYRYLSGDRTGALRQFERCREALARELDVEPEPATVELFEQIRDDRVPRRAVE